MGIATEALSVPGEICCLTRVWESITRISISRGIACFVMTTHSVARKLVDTKLASWRCSPGLRPTVSEKPNSGHLLHITQSFYRRPKI